MKIGYMRISSSSQKLDRQEVIMEKLSVDRIYVDVQSGKDTSRPELQRMLSEIQNGDTLIVESISRFARNTKDLLNLIEKLDEKEVKDRKSVV